MAAGITVLSVCCAYLSWAIISSDKLFHQTLSVLITILAVIWPPSSVFSKILFGVSVLTGFFLFSPGQVLLPNWLVPSSKSEDAPDQYVQEYLPRNNDARDQESHIDVDVVAVHGLGSHFINAWTGDPTQPNSAFWLRDFLPNEKDIKIRVLNYSHNSRWMSRAPKKFVSDYGYDLLRAVQGKRAKPEEQNRPIVFVGHSFGGLIIKQMIVNAQRDSSEYSCQLILHNTRGLVFIGTPHQGARMTSVGKAWSMLGFWRGSSTMFLDFAKPLSELNIQLHETFMKVWSNCFACKNIVCVFETMPQTILGYPITEIVERKSAVIPGFRAISMEQSHRHIQRFAKPTDPTYVAILSSIREWVFTDVKTSMDEEFLRSISYPQMLSSQNSISDPHPGTCSWIFEHGSFQSWIEEDWSVLWIRGPPGSGKSTLTSFLIQNISDSVQKTDRLVLSFFFNGRSDAIERSSEGLLLSLLHQLYYQVPMVRSYLRSSLHGKGFTDPRADKQNWLRRDLEATFLVALQKLRSSARVFLFLDGLDEAEKDEIRQITSFLQRLQSLQPSSEDSTECRCSVKVCIACRYYPVVALIPGLEVRMEESNHTDIIRYLEDNLNSDLLPSEWTLDQKAWGEIIRELSGMASTSFQWAKLVVNIAFDCVPDGLSVPEVCERLLELPLELDKLYRYILEQIVNQRYLSKALFLFQWVCLSGRPMSVMELRYALSIEESSLAEEKPNCENTKGFVQNDERMVLQITALSGGLLEVCLLKDGYVNEYNSTSIVRAIHQSVLDFMISSGLTLLVSRTNFFIDNSLVTSGARSEKANTAALHALQNRLNDTTIRSASHYRLFMACICYLVLEPPDLSKYMTPWSEGRAGIPVKDVLQDRPLLLYAATNIFYHANKAQRFQLEAESDWAEVLDLLMLVFQDWVNIHQLVAENSQSGPNDQSTLLQVASRHGLTGVVHSILLTSMGSINRQDQKGCTALHYAARGGHHDITRLLLKHNANPNVIDKRRYHPLIEAVATEDCAWKRCFECHHYGPISKGHLETIKLLILAGANLDHSSTISGNALQEACRHGRTQAVEYLLKSGAEVNSVSGVEGTALIVASLHGQGDIVKLLVKGGANVNQQVGKFETALTAAVFRNREDVIDTLLESGAGSHLPGNWNSPVLVAARYGREKIFFKLFHRISTNVVRSRVINAAICSAAPRSTDFAMRLLSSQTDINIEQNCLNHALYEASCYGNVDFVNMVLDAGADINFSMVTYPKSCAIDVDFDPCPYANALQGSIYHCRDSVVDTLISRGADVNVRGGKFELPLFAVFNQCNGVEQMDRDVRILLKAGANINVRNSRGESPFQVATRRGFESIARVLLAADTSCN